jgi:hypothetical protein
MKHDYLQFITELDSFFTMVGNDASLDDLIEAFDRIEERPNFARHDKRYTSTGKGTLVELYEAHLEQLRGACRDAYTFIHPNDVDHILVKLNGALGTYRDGPPQPFYQLLSDCRESVHKGLWSVLRSATDLGVTDETIDELENGVWEWLRFHKTSPLYTDGVARPENVHFANGTTSATTRLRNKAGWLARAWKTDRLRARSKFVDTGDVDKLMSNTGRTPVRKVDY